MLTLANYIQRQGQSLRSKRSDATRRLNSANAGNAEATTGDGSSSTSATQDANLAHDIAEVSVSAAPPTSQPQVASPEVANPPAAQTQRLRVTLPLHIRLQGMAGAAESFIVRHRTSSMLIFAYCSFFWRIFGQVGNPDSVTPPKPVAMTEYISGSMFFDPAVDPPLTRASVLSRAARGTMRRADKDEQALDESEDDTLALLEEALRVAAGQKDPVRRAALLAECYAALGRMHSARGHYYEMLHAMSLALRSGADAGDSETVSNLQVMLGHLELNHHRYYAAGTRFEDALQTSVNDTTRTEALAGLGWVAIAQGDTGTAGGHLMAALGWTAASLPLRRSAFPRMKCSAHLDGLDSARAFSMAGLALADARQSGHVVASTVLLDCAAFLLRSMPMVEQEAHVWRALGLARHVLAEVNTARLHHQQAVLREHRDPALAAAYPEVWSCATSANLPSCSHNALHQGLVEFSAGNASLGIGHVELLLSRTGAVPAEAAEWLTRFARAHSWTPSGRDFTTFLLGRAEPLLKGEGEGKLARHLLGYGRFLLSHVDAPSRLKRALRQLRRAQDIIEKVEVGWPETEIAAMYSTIANVHHQLGEIEEAAQSFEHALSHCKKSALNGEASWEERLVLAHANLGAARLQLAGSSPTRWRKALEVLSQGRRVAREAGLDSNASMMKEFEASYRNAMRLAHHKGMLETCPGPLDALLHGPSCPKDA